MLTIFEVFVSILLNVNISLNQTLLTFLLYVRQTRMTQLILQFLSDRLSSFNQKRFCYSYAWCCSLYEGGTPFYMGLISRKICRFLLMFTTGFTSFSDLLLFSLWITFLSFKPSKNRNLGTRFFVHQLTCLGTSLSIYKNIYLIQIKFQGFFQRKIIDKFSETNN